MQKLPATPVTLQKQHMAEKKSLKKKKKCFSLQRQRFLQGPRGFVGSQGLEMAPVQGCKQHHTDAPGQALLGSGFVKASRKWLIYFFSTPLENPLLEYIPVAGLGQVFHNVVYSSFLGLLHAVNSRVISGSSRWNSGEGKRWKLLEEHSAALLLSHACGTSKNNS